MQRQVSSVEFSQVCRCSSMIPCPHTVATIRSPTGILKPKPADLATPSTTYSSCTGARHVTHPTVYRCSLSKPKGLVKCTCAALHTRTHLPLYGLQLTFIISIPPASARHPPQIVRCSRRHPPHNVLVLTASATTQCTGARRAIHLIAYQCSRRLPPHSAPVLSCSPRHPPHSVPVLFQ